MQSKLNIFRRMRKSDAFESECFGSGFVDFNEGFLAEGKHVNLALRYIGP